MLTTSAVELKTFLLGCSGEAGKLIGLRNCFGSELMVPFEPGIFLSCHIVTCIVHWCVCGKIGCSNMPCIEFCFHLSYLFVSFAVSPTKLRTLCVHVHSLI